MVADAQGDAQADAQVLIKQGGELNGSSSESVEVPDQEQPLQQPCVLLQPESGTFWDQEEERQQKQQQDEAEEVPVPVGKDIAG